MPIPTWVIVKYEVHLRSEYQQQMNELIRPFITVPGNSRMPKRIEENGIEAYNVELTRFTDKREVGGDGNERSMTSWDLYNNITNKLSHDNRGLTFNSALKHYGELDRVFAV